MHRLIPGAIVYWREQRWVLADILATDVVLLRNAADGTTEHAPPGELRLSATQPRTTQLAELVPEPQFREAVERYKALLPLLNKPARSRTREEVIAVADELHVSRATVYRLLQRWEETLNVTAFLRPQRKDKGGRRLSAEVEKIVEHFIRTRWMVKERETIKVLTLEIKGECKKLKLKPPHISTVRQRILSMPQQEVVKAKKGVKAARKRFSTAIGEFPWQDHPWHCYQIDHTPVDVIVVDDEHRRPLGRAYLTVVIDVCTRMIVGFCLSLEPPGVMSAGLAMAHALLPKEKWLLERGINASWPIYGPAKIVHSDNAEEFKSEVFRKACMDNGGAETARRPKGFPNCGGHIERVLGTFMTGVHSLPGTTFSNTTQRGDYDSEGKAVMTLGELERWIALFITTWYHLQPHSEIGGVPPLNRFNALVLGTPEKPGIGLPVPLVDELKVRLDFTPRERRTIRAEGVLIDHIYYYADVLQRWVGFKEMRDGKLRHPKFIFVRDPRDVSVLYFYEPDTKLYHPVGYRDPTRPPMTLWELKDIVAEIESDPLRVVNEDSIFEGLQQRRAIVAEATQKTKNAKSALRQTQRLKEAQKASAERKKLEAEEAKRRGAADSVLASASPPGAARSGDDDDDDDYIPTYDSRYSSR